MPAWVITIGGVIYVGILAWNAASSFINRKKALATDVPVVAKGPDMVVTGASIADRTSVMALAEGCNNLADAIVDAFGPKGALIGAAATLSLSLGRLSTVYEKRVAMEEKEEMDREIERRAEELAARRAGKT